MNELRGIIFEKWIEASRNYTDMASFTVNYTSTVDEFMKLLDTWRVRYTAFHNEFRISFVLINYYKFIQDKTYYSDNGITEDIEAEYYA